MEIINSRKDLETYVAQRETGAAVDGITGALHRAYLADSDAPEYGRDWSEWLDRNYAAAVAATVETGISSDPTPYTSDSAQRSGPWARRSRD